MSEICRTALGKILFSLTLILSTFLLTRTLYEADYVGLTTATPSGAENLIRYENYCEWANLVRTTSPNFPEMATIYVITPTKKRLSQKADLTRLSHTLQLVPKLHWILIEDSGKKSEVVEDLLRRSCLLNYTHLAVGKQKSLVKGKGMIQRNAGINLLRQMYENHSTNDVNAVVYFADDDNSYDLRLFTDYIRHVKGVGIWAVAFSGNNMVEAPKIDGGKVVGWDTSFAPKRKFATDMAGFAINLRLFLENKEATFHEKCKVSHFESCLLSQLNIKKENMEPFGFESPKNGKREVLVWHIKTKKIEKARGGEKGFVVS